jgi:hypothetical protein
MSSATTVPIFQETFTVGGQAYPFTMVGTDPKLPAQTTRIPTVVVPIRFVFADGSRFGRASSLRRLRRSPLFRPSAFTTGVTQYGDAIRRAGFWQYTQDGGYHVLLRRPRTTATAVVRVPSSLGFTAKSSFGGNIGVVTESFFSENVVPRLINRLHLPPTALVIFWTKDVDLQQPGEPGAILGEHSAGTDASGTAIWTWAFAAWHSVNTTETGSEDIAVLSHEIAEWYADPFASNAIPPAFDAVHATCMTALEVGDPLVGVTFVQDGYHLQDEAFLSWFARQVPSIGISGGYSYLGTLSGPSASCTGS